MVKVETERIYLRQWKESDRDPFFELNSDKETMRFFPSPYTRELSDGMMDKSMAVIEAKGYGLFAAELKSSSEFIGFIGILDTPYETPFTPCIEIGWRLHKKFWKKGYASEAAEAVLNFAFNQISIIEVVSFTSKLNLPSIAVMERIGMIRDINGDFDHPKVQEGHPLRPHVLYRLNADNFFE